MQTQGMAARLSKFKVGDLALKSALELERARAGVPFDRTQLSALAEALRLSAGAQDVSGQISHMRPGYFEPFERVYRSRLAGDPKTFAEVQDFVTKAISEIDAAATEDLTEEITSKLVDFCLELNREFVRRQPAESRIGRRQRSIPIEALVG